MKKLFISYYMVVEYLLIFGLILESLSEEIPKKWSRGKRGDIVLIQGYAEKWNHLKTIASALNKKGYKIHIIHELDYNYVPINKAAKIVAEYVDKNKLESFYLLSHSKGGLIAKMYIDKFDSLGKVKKSISIASPYLGTKLGYLKVRYLHEMIPESDYIKDLNKELKNNHKIVNLYSEFDNHVIPNRNVILKGGKNILIPVAGHTRILKDKRTIKEIEKLLEK